MHLKHFCVGVLDRVGTCKQLRQILNTSDGELQLKFNQMSDGNSKRSAQNVFVYSETGGE